MLSPISFHNYFEKPIFVLLFILKFEKKVAIRFFDKKRAILAIKSKVVSTEVSYTKMIFTDMVNGKRVSCESEKFFRYPEKPRADLKFRTTIR